MKITAILSLAATGVVLASAHPALADDLENAAIPEAVRARTPAQPPAPTGTPPSTPPPANAATPPAPAASAPAPSQVVYPPNTAPEQRVYEPPPPAVPSGQWVYTSQYGWVWMPYERAYTYVTPEADRAYAYVYYPVAGWRWVWAPWVLSVGPAPYWGVYGPSHFVWYSRPWFRPHHVYGGYYRPRGFVGGGVAVGGGGGVVVGARFGRPGYRHYAPAHRHYAPVHRAPAHYGGHYGGRGFRR